MHYDQFIHFVTLYSYHIPAIINIKKKKKFNCHFWFVENMNSQQTQCQINPQRVFMIL